MICTYSTAGARLGRIAAGLGLGLVLAGTAGVVSPAPTARADLSHSAAIVQEWNSTGSSCQTCHKES